MTDVWTEARSKRTSFPPPVGDDVTASSRCDDVGHREKVEKTTTSAISKSDVTEGDESSNVGHQEKREKTTAAPQ